MARQHFAEEMLDRIDLDVGFLKKIMFTDHWIFSCGFISRAMCSELQLTDLMT
jgi:hypothetical protein